MDCSHEWVSSFCCWQGMGGVALAVVDERARAAGTSSAGRRVLGTFTLALAHVFRELKEDPLRSVLRAAVNHFPVAAGASSSTLSRRRSAPVVVCFLQCNCTWSGVFYMS